MAFPDRRTLNVLLTVLLVAGVCALAFYARRIILLFVCAIFFAYLIDPLVGFLEKHSLLFRNMRGSAVLEVYLAFILVIVVLGYELAPGVGRNVTKLVDEIPVLLDGLSTGEIASDLGDKYDWSEAQELRFKGFLLRHRDNIQDLVKAVDHYLSDAAEVFGFLLLIPILAIFFLRDGDHMVQTLINFIAPPHHSEAARTIAAELHIVLTRYIRAQVILCGFSLLFYVTAMLLLGFPHALGLAVLGGVLEFIPVVGWISTAAAIVGVGMVHHCHWIWMILLLAVWRIVQDYVTYPRVLGRQLEIHPLAAIFAVLVGADIGGIVGIYLSVPLVASLCVIWKVYATPQGAGQSPRFALAETPDLVRAATK
jgi:predicted PurR-regulated permease PerM